MAWDDHWKEISRHGFDVSKENWVIDYTNNVYAMILHLFTDLDNRCRVAMETMALHFESLHPNAMLTEYVVERQADIIEIVIAALRGHEFFRPIFARITEISGRRIPELLVVLFDLCKLVQYLDAFLTTGYLRHKREKVPELLHRIPGMTSDKRFAIWRSGSERERHRVFLKMFRRLQEDTVPMPGAIEAYGAPMHGIPMMAEAASGLPMGWEQATDPSSGIAYYCNRSTGESAWEPPFTGSATMPSSAPTSADLPPGWETAADPATGESYYFNRSTGETSWTLESETWF